MMRCLQESDDELLDRLIYEASCNNEYDNRDRLQTAREALKKRLADLRKKKVQA